MQQVAADILDQVDARRSTIELSAERELYVTLRLVDSGLRKGLAHHLRLKAASVIVGHEKDQHAQIGAARVERSEQRSKPTGDFTRPISRYGNMH